MKPIAFLFATLVFASALVTNLSARPQYNKEFTNVVKANEALSKAAGGKSHCTFCHAAVGPKKFRNDFGKAVEPWLKKNEMDTTIIAGALDAAARQKVKPDGEETFGDQIRAGTLPR